MYSLPFNKIYNATVEEIFQLKEKQKQEISLDDSDEYHDLRLKCIQEIESKFEVEIEFPDINIGLINKINIKHLIDISKKINLPLSIYIKGGEYFKENMNKSIQFLYKDETLNLFKEINDFLKENNEKELIFIESDITSNNLWQLNHINKANDRIQKVCDRITKNNLSPMEAMAFIHKVVTLTFKYKENNENPGLARTIAGALNTDNIVCVGYSVIVKSIIDKLDNDNLMCDTNVIKFRNLEIEKNEDLLLIGTMGSHEQNLIFINDEKYDVNGVYISDATFDSKNDIYPSGKGFANFLLPVEDLICYKGVKAIQYEDSVDNFLASLGIENEFPEIPPVITKYKDRSKPIPYETLEKAIRNMMGVVYVNQDDDTLDDIFENIMRNSRIRSHLTFNENAINSIYQKTKEYNYN